MTERIAGALLLGSLLAAVFFPGAATGGSPITYEVGVMERTIEDRPAGVAAVEGDGPRAQAPVRPSAPGVTQLREITGVSGRGVTIAIVDTGIDPGHSDLAATSDRVLKISDWIDVSGEGTINTPTAVRLGTGWVRTSLGMADMREVASRSGTVFVGTMAEQQIEQGGRIQQDLDRNGRTGDEFLVVVADSAVAGLYDTVYVDIDRSLKMTADRAMREYRYSGAIGWFGTRGPFRPSTAFVISRIAADGRSVIIGFDGNGHGTHVAGIAAAAGERYGGMDGIAPGARLLAVKALGSSGRGEWDQIRRGVVAAVEAGADIVSVSVTALQTGTGLDSGLFRTLAEKHGTIFIVAAGNNGPALGSAAVSSEPTSMVIAGAYVPSRMWLDAYGYRAPDTLWYFSAVGPGPQGRQSPDVIAPGSAISTVPSWEGPDCYDLLEGSSMAVPHVAGVAALLIEASAARRIELTPALLREALRRGAKPLDGYSEAEQGCGAIDALAGWEWLRTIGATLSSASQLDWSIVNPQAKHGLVTEGGIFSRDIVPARASLSVRSPWQHSRLSLSSTSSWLQPDRTALNLTAGSLRTFDVQFNVPAEPGLYAGTLIGQRGPRVEMEMFAATVLPHSLDLSANRWLRVSHSLPPGRYTRDYLDVPVGTRTLSLRLIVPRTATEGGRVRMHVFSPDGKDEYLSPFVGVPDPGASHSLSRAISWPKPGVWEVVTYSSAALSEHGLEQSRYTLEAKADFVHIIDPPAGIISVEPGSNWSQRVTVRSVGASLFLSPAFLSGGASQVVLRERPTIHRDGSVTRILPDVAPETVLLRVAVGNPSDLQADLDLYLYRQDEGSRDWREVARSATALHSDEAVEIRSPSPGRYVAYVDTKGQAADAVSFTLEAIVVPEGGQVGDEQKWLVSGQTWSMSVGGASPPQGGSRSSVLGLDDVNLGRLAALLPVRIDASRPRLIVSAFPGVLLPDARSVMITVLEQETGRPVDLVAEVNGRLYLCRRGRIEVPISSGTQAVTLRVAIDDSRYRFLSRTITINPRRPDVPLASGYLIRNMLRDKIRDRL